MCSASSGSGRRTSGHGAGSISCRRRPRRLSSILRKITGTPTSGRRSGRTHRSGSTSQSRRKREMKSNSPVKGPVWQTDRGRFFRRRSGVHTHGKCWLKRLYFTLNSLSAVLTLQFSGLATAPFLEGGCSTVKWKRTPVFRMNSKMGLFSFSATFFDYFDLIRFQPVKTIRQRIDLPVD
jgi:hypothetical protein